VTSEKAQTAAQAAIGVGYDVDVIQDQAISGNWKVIVRQGLTMLDLKLISDFATANGLIGHLNSVTLL
jgi:hypothetical protein